MKQLIEYTETELKAMAYDNIGVRDSAINNINLIIQELNRRAEIQKKAKEEPKQV